MEWTLPYKLCFQEFYDLVKTQGSLDQTVPEERSACGNKI